MTLRREALPRLLSADWASLERRVQALRRVLWGRGGVRWGARQVRPRRRGQARRVAVRGGGPRRPVHGRVGDDTLRCAAQRCAAAGLRRACGGPTIIAYHCAPCGQGHVPLGAQVGWGTGALSPARLRVVCRAGVEETFADVVRRPILYL